MSRGISERRKKLLEALTVAGRESSNAAVMYHSAMGEKLGLGMTEEKTLDLLQRFGPLTAGELSQRTGLAPASVSGLIDRLESKSLVRRVRDTKDRRRIIVEINYERLAGFSALFEPFMTAMAGLYERYTDEELEVILDYLVRSAALQREATTELASLPNDPTAG
ncbi:MarR family winged helix-turn-helix transcriptional regulator [Thermostaphylospora chromogena]|uniref:DNA-binding transcriptional regulator, MarR family n=1 Tax=Thermostaphylospora chromogena TaxID=35622 RepID=A0A1H1HUL1_9ACTN|nr:MarR family transcriptional regulator [Thermostaphylospora chromogena]SDR29009.1 DNA-binding transcriptional regulator, MarR family [Thermostaphylospora chromogena]